MPSEAVVARLAMPRSRRRLCVRVSTVVVASERSTAGTTSGRPRRAVGGPAASRAEVEVLLRHAHAADAIGERVVEALEERRPRPREALDGQELPQGPGAVERVVGEGHGEVAERVERAGLGQGDGRTWRHTSKSGSVRHSGGARRPSAGTHALAQAGHHGGGVRHAGAEAVEVGRPVEQRDVGEARREVRILLEVPHQGLEVRHAALVVHGAVCHRPSGYEAARRHGQMTPPDGTGRSGGQRGMEVCLNSLSSGYPVSRSRMRSIVRPGQLAVARRVGA